MLTGTCFNVVIGIFIDLYLKKNQSIEDCIPSFFFFLKKTTVFSQIFLTKKHGRASQQFW